MSSDQATTIQQCATCARGFVRADNGKICCGSGVDDGALQGRYEGVNPIWAERKYGPARLLSLIHGVAAAPDGSDCDNMDPTDGAACKVWQVKDNADG